MRPKYLVVLPYAVQEWADRCINSMRLQEQGRVMFVDNTVNNVGIMRSHNLALDAREPDEWLIILSAALEFGPDGGLDFIDNIAEHTDHAVVSASCTFGWHMVAFDPNVASKMGRWDENFTPYGYDDLDLSIRIHRLFPEGKWGGYPIMVKDHGMAHSVKVGGIGIRDADYLLGYWHRKWGAAPGSEFPDYSTHPFGNVSHHINYWPDYNGAKWNEPCATP